MKQALADVRDNTVQVTGDSSLGTGFFVQKEYCVTCHHVICRMDKIRIRHKGHTYSAKWVEDPSLMDKDIAILRVGSANVRPLGCAMETTPLLTVSVWGFTLQTKSSLPMGLEIKGELSSETTLFQSPEQHIRGTRPWNKKPKTGVDVYQLQCSYAGVGLSGAPVWEPNRRKIVGMFSAVQGPDPYRDVSTVGYVIPIDEIVAIPLLQKILNFDKIRIGPIKPTEKIKTSSVRKGGYKVFSPEVPAGSPLLSLTLEAKRKDMDLFVYPPKAKSTTEIQVVPPRSRSGVKAVQVKSPTPGEWKAVVFGSRAGPRTSAFRLTIDREGKKFTREGYDIRYG